MIELEHDRRYLNQWALDQRVQIDNFLPGTWVDFSLINDCRNGSLTTEAYEECGHVYANIPNVLLQSFGYLRVYVNPPASDMVHTPEEKDIKVVRQRKPAHYIYTETPTVSYSSKVDIFWGTEHAGKAVVVGDDGYLTASKKTVEDNIATDDEVDDMFDDVFDGENNPEGENPGGEVPDGGEDPAPDNPDGGESGGGNTDDNPTDDNPNGDNIATDEEVNDMFDDVFGN